MENRFNKNETYVQVEQRVEDLIQIYGLEHFILTCQDLTTKQHGITCRSKSIDGFLPIHIKNLIRTYGQGLVSAVVKCEYSRQTKKGA
jgi:hypothetical protein